VSISSIRVKKQRGPRFVSPMNSIRTRSPVILARTPVGNEGVPYGSVIVLFFSRYRGDRRPNNTKYENRKCTLTLRNIIWRKTETVRYDRGALRLPMPRVESILLSLLPSCLRVSMSTATRSFGKTISLPGHVTVDV